MTFSERLTHHETLVRRMAGRAGVDLDLAQQCGAVAPGEVRAAVHACLGCLHPGDCAARLDTGTPGVPDYCRNADMLDDLARLFSGD